MTQSVVYPVKVNKKKLLTSLKIGSVSMQQLSKLSMWELIKLYEIFYLEVFNGTFSFCKATRPNAKSEGNWVICIPPSRFILNMLKFFLKKHEKDESELKSLVCLLRDSLGLRESEDVDWIMDSYIIQTPAIFNAVKKIQNDCSSLESWEYTFLRCFIFWLTGLHLDRDIETVVMKSTVLNGNGKGDLLVLFNETGEEYDTLYFCSRPSWWMLHTLSINFYFREAFR